MTFQELLSDPNFQTVVLPLFTTLIPVVLGWIVGQVAADQKQAKWGRWLKLVIETPVLMYIFTVFPEAMAAFNSDDPTAKVIGLLYGVVLVGLLGMMVVDVVQLVHKPSMLTAAELDEARWQDNRQTLMDKVRVKWIDGVLKKSLYEQARIAVGLEERPEMVGVEWQTAGEEKQVLPPGTRLLDRFANLGRGGTLLVLGEPGAGKTTLLLELAQDLLEATDFQELKQPIPIVVNLSAWGTQQFSKDGTLVFTQWLLEELWQQYQVRKEVGNTWLKQQQWILLLDGLDEVKPQYRDACVEALNQFRQKFGNIEIALCCRIADYQELNIRLEGFQAALYVKPLTEKQVDDYLQKVGKAVEEIVITLRENSSLYELTSTPLFLWILTITYQHRPADELLNSKKDQRLKLLFDSYINQMFIQRPVRKKERMKQQLSLIAKKMEGDKSFLIESMKPNKWFNKIEKWAYKLVCSVLIGIFFGLTGFILGLFLQEPKSGFIGALVGFLIGLIWIANKPICFVDSLMISPPHKLFSSIKKQLLQVKYFSLIITLIYIVIFGGFHGVKYGLTFGVSIGITVWLIIGGIFGLIDGLKVDIQASGNSSPNQAVWNSLKNMAKTCIASFIFMFLVYQFLFTILPFFLNEERQIDDFIFSVICVPFLASCIAGGGLACIQHFALRIVLALTQQIPWNFVTFFKQAEDRLFIYRTGGSYVFIHRYLQEHFANLSFDET
ncbi:NACHT domain-containing protein [Acaryochloris marina]|uniref:NACHT domain-containing protein n=1 Tax=Acaryochloris marina TaxID=155978 RepID=UPI0021C41A4B|nr:NACHT domain-containing protein [Acaryochloris marina]BDM82546.1 hypothetical protein AM10699_54070 [Acaryochloris marina MBIC10699]